MARIQQAPVTSQAAPDASSAIDTPQQADTQVLIDEIDQAFQCRFNKTLTLLAGRTDPVSTWVREMGHHYAAFLGQPALAQLPDGHALTGPLYELQDAGQQLLAHARDAAGKPHPTAYGPGSAPRFSLSPTGNGGMKVDVQPMLAPSLAT